MKPADKPAFERSVMQRRKLLGAAGTTGALAAAATLLTAPKGEVDAQAQADLKTAPERGGGYRLTEHVLRYYQTTKV
jgi:hypothetical protein